MILDKTITVKENHTQQKTFSLEQNWNLVEKKFRYPLPRQLIKAAELSVNIDVHENIGIMKFNIAMILAKI